MWRPQEDVCHATYLQSDVNSGLIVSVAHIGTSAYALYFQDVFGMPMLESLTIKFITFNLFDRLHTSEYE